MYVVSACLLGANCKYNGGNNDNEAVKDFCEEHKILAVCPETAGGLKAPRPPAEQTGGKVMDREGRDVTLVATGTMLDVAMKSAEALAAEGIDAEILNLGTFKPLDKELILASAEKTGRVVVMEEGIINGGMSSAVAALLAEKHPVPMRFVALDDCFGQSGDAADLMEAYGLNVTNTLAKVKELL